MPRRRNRGRSIGAGLSAAAEALGPILSGYANNRRNVENSVGMDLLNRKQTLQDKVTKGEISPDQAAAELPGVDFSAFQPSMADRSAAVSKDIAGAHNLSELPTENRVRRRMQELDIPQDQPDAMVNGPSSVMGFPLVASTKPSDPAASLMEELNATKTNLQAQVPATTVESRDPRGLLRRKFVPNNQLAGTDVAIDQTPEQKSALDLSGLQADANNQIPELRGTQAGQQKVSELTTAGPAEAQQAGAVANAQNASHARFAGPIAENTAAGTIRAEGSPAGLDYLKNKAEIEAGAKPPTAQEAQAYDYAGRVAKAHQVMLRLEPEIAKRGGIANYAALNAPESVQDPTTRLYSTALRELINANLRRESGAAISPTEFTQAMQQYGFTPGETPESLRYKQDARRRTIQGMAGSTGKLSSNFATIQELQAIAAQRSAGGGKPATVDDVAAEAEAQGIRVIY